MTNTFQDKVVLITGATGGIGEAVAHELASRGAIIVASGRRSKEGEAVAEAIRKAGGRASFLQADVSKEADVKRLVDVTLSQHGRLDFAFNNAGIEGTVGLTTEMQTEENYRSTFDINVLGVLLSMKHEIPALLKNGGAIVNTSSVAGRVGLPGAGVYVASKHAVEGLTKSAALEFAKQGVRVNAVAPGAIQTDMLDRFIGEAKSDNPNRDWLTSLHPVGRIGTIGETALAVIALLENPFITGTTLTVDGGWTAQ
jgi:NAD(P)-dependent dehydrogenase (short-subunit alcohol dehydrogenase family)